MKIRGVVFDMDGLLLDSEQLYFKAYKDTRKALQLHPDDALFLSMVGTNNVFGRQLLKDGLGAAVTLAQFEDVWAIHCAREVANGIPLKAGVLELLAALTDASIPFAIATSTSTERAQHHLSDAGLRGHFPIVVGGDQVEKSKPEPDIYLKACECLELLPQDCCAFEDSENGVLAALAAGLVTVQVPDLKQPSAEFRNRGHTVASDLISGAKAISLI